MTNGSVDSILDILEEKGTLDEVSHFLRARDLTHSASSWEQMRGERIRPAYRAGDLTEHDLLRLLGELEEHGHQYIFLYQLVDRPTDVLLDEGRVRDRLEDMEAEDVLHDPLFLDQPDEPTVAAVRFEPGPYGESLVLKVVETRIYVERLGRRDRGNRVYDIRYRDVPTRAVNLFRLHSNGLLELRLEEHKTSSRNYDDEREQMWALANQVFPRGSFSPLSLSRAKYSIWENRDSLRDFVRYSNSQFLDAEGNSLHAAAGGRGHDLAQDPAVTRSLDEFNRGETTCSTAVVWWLEQDGEPPSKDLRTRIAGQRNEFSITAKCNREDYEHVLQQILAFNETA